MKKILILVFIIVCLSACQRKTWLFTGFNEPAKEGLRFIYSKDGYHWTDAGKTFLKPVLGDSIMRDPSIIQGPDGTFHLVWTLAWTGNKGFGYSSSKDLIHWSEQKQIPIMKDSAGTVNVWAPELFYDDTRNQFLIIWASTIPYRFPKGIEDERNNHRMYYTLTPDFKTFSPAKLYLDPGFSVIDCVLKKRADKDYVLVLKDNTRLERNIKISFATDPLGPFTASTEAFTPNFTEGPAVLQNGNEWLIYYDQYRDKIFGTQRTIDFKNFENITDRVTVPEGHKHGTIISIKRRYLKNILD